MRDVKFSKKAFRRGVVLSPTWISNGHVLLRRADVEGSYCCASGLSDDFSDKMSDRSVDEMMQTDKAVPCAVTRLLIETPEGLLCRIISVAEDRTTMVQRRYCKMLGYEVGDLLWAIPSGDAMIVVDNKEEPTRAVMSISDSAGDIFHEARQ